MSQQTDFVVYYKRALFDRLPTQTESKDYIYTYLGKWYTDVRSLRSDANL